MTGNCDVRKDAREQWASSADKIMSLAMISSKKEVRGLLKNLNSSDPSKL